jgi:hypothetical protein
VGAHYLADLILPKYKIECPEPPAGTAIAPDYWQYMDRLIDVFGSEVYPERAQNSISGFVGTLETAGLLMESEGQEINRVLTPVKDYFALVRPVIDDAAEQSES